MIDIKTSTSRGTLTLRVSGDFTYGSAKTVLAAFRTALAKAKPLRVDLTGVGAIDLAGLQLLYSLEASARAAGIDTVFVAGDKAERFARLTAFAGLRAVVTT